MKNLSKNSRAARVLVVLLALLMVVAYVPSLFSVYAADEDETTSVTVYVKWRDPVYLYIDALYQGIRYQHGPATLTLYADGVPTEYSLVIDGTADAMPNGPGGYEISGQTYYYLGEQVWKSAFVNLPKYREENGEKVEIEYTVIETEETSGYVPDYGVDEDGTQLTCVGDGGLITNISGERTIYVRKRWLSDYGSEDEDYSWPEGAEVTIDLYADGADTGLSVTLNGNSSYLLGEPEEPCEYMSGALFYRVPRYREGTTTPIEYSIVETCNIPGYTSYVRQLGLPDDPAYDDEAPHDVILDIGEPWLLFYRKDVTLLDNIQDAGPVTVTKEWHNADGSAAPPEGAEVTLTLYANGEPTEYSVTLNGETGVEPDGPGGYESAPWTATFLHLPKRAYLLKWPYEMIRPLEWDGPEIVYTVVETISAPGYTASYEGEDENGNALSYAVSGGSITNTQEAVSVTGQVIWEDEDDKEGIRPDSVTVTLLQDGVPVGTVTVDENGTVTEDGGWAFTFDGLPKTNPVTGEEYSYTVTQNEVSGYTTETEGSMEDGFTIVNTHVPKETPADEDNDSTPPRTGDEQGLFTWVMIFALAAAACVRISARSRD